MNPETGDVYRTAEEIRAARQRGEPLVPVSERVAKLVQAGKVHERQLARRRARRKAAKASRRRNR